MKIRKMGMVGCGLMGRGIVEVCARADYDVLVSTSGDESLERGLAAIEASLARAVEKGRATAEEKKAAMSHITGTVRIEDFKECDLVIESVNEDLELKRRIFLSLDKVCQDHTILATNTSCLSVMEIASATRRPDRVLGVHFFNPVPFMKLIELVKTFTTSEETMVIGRSFAESLGKVVIMTTDSPGFIVVRLVMPFVLGAIRLYESGVATKEEIDQAITLGLNYPTGPLSLCDFIGLDTILSIATAMHQELGDAQYAPPVLLKRLVAAGHLGRKTSKGFYYYK
ncbi:MAG: 3-hydroxybutyryl-CoA dehydrogenase [Dehalococcoidales bacterium]|jgi:3-hydroxybutyryl-CoA dehydrogenase|nr:3-hydroxybutyryl-CoA dehydrogenase [Dehalococcoidales bacterium]MDP7309535.1 3-hydroxybutyryl-CoA dehydrogenase [Dehalococcoidales bacterium]MDP7409532.1 3-hydroxybutyryl-CoA dehydrogenase [Dehalococcoidales bacterium]MDP7675867.1 3-hydroxybutyryl-CoA dehydrogenase [Dehalococcoidales bacterium]HJM37100.1 3-hydroxybutyryl-CoA dehydrogenase [Dehalococcoidales bacterium]